MSIQPATPDILDECLIILEVLTEKDPNEAFIDIHTRSNGNLFRDTETVENRYACAFYLHERGFSLPEIASAVGYKSHSSAEYGSKKYKQKIDNGEVNEIPDSRFAEIKQQGASYQTDPNSCYSRIDRLCLETLDAMDVTDPERTLRQMRKRKNGRLNRSHHISQIRLECASRLAAPHHHEMSHDNIARVVGYSDSSTVAYAVRKLRK